jgi:hypothetical protein
MSNLIDKTKDLLAYFTWVGTNPPLHSQDKTRMAALIHPDYLLTYNGRPVICGIDHLGGHFVDAYREAGHFHIELQSVKLLGRIRTVAQYFVVTEHKGRTPCDVTFEFRDGLCIAQHDVLDFGPSNINAASLLHRGTGD